MSVLAFLVLHDAADDGNSDEYAADDQADGLGAHGTSPFVFTAPVQ
jgi:hypothetical protein